MVVRADGNRPPRRWPESVPRRTTLSLDPVEERRRVVRKPPRLDVGRCLDRSAGSALRRVVARSAPALEPTPQCGVVGARALALAHPERAAPHASTGRAYGGAGDGAPARIRRARD